MKNLKWVCLCMLGVLGLSSCQKDGVYHPKKKISQICKEENGQMSLDQTWTWDKDNLVAITDADGERTTYTYNKSDQLIKISTNENYTEIEYNEDNRVFSMKCFTKNGTELLVFSFTYDKKDLSSVRCDMSGMVNNMPNGKVLDQSGLACLMNPRMIETLKGTLNRLKSDENSLKAFTVSAFVTWTPLFDGGNLKNLTEEITTVINGVTSKVSYATTYTYDKKTNPFYKLIDDAQVFDMGTSKNNILTQMTYDQNNDLKTIIEYTYTYEGKYPISCEVKEDREEPITIYVEYL